MGTFSTISSPPPPRESAGIAFELVVQRLIYLHCCLPASANQGGGEDVEDDVAGGVSHNLRFGKVMVGRVSKLSGSTKSRTDSHCNVT